MVKYYFLPKNIFGGAEFESDINFYIRLLWVLKWEPKIGVKCKPFDWNMSYINFNIFGDVESESDISNLDPVKVEMEIN